jgi:hypothetical protein
MEPQRVVQTILGLYSIDEKTVGAAFGLYLPLHNENPYWAFFRNEQFGVFKVVELAISKRDHRWRFTVDYSLDHANYLENTVDFSLYGAVVKMDVNPDIPPEGTYSKIFLYSGYKLYFEFTSRTHRILGITVEQP